MKVPRVSVIMPVYNAETFVRETIDSILYQSFADFEFLIVDDGSSDKSFDVISTYIDQRIRVYKNDMNIGYVRTLNHLICLAKGEYIARQDADDISLPKRLEQQVCFMENNLDVGVCGTNAKIFGKKNWKTSVPIKDADIRANMIFRNPLLHTSVMIRRSMFLDGGITKYDYYYCPSEDYALWFEFSLKAKLTNLPAELVLYRCHDKNVSLINEKIQIENANRIRHRVLECSLSIVMTEKEKCLHDLFFMSSNININDLKALEKWYLKLLSTNKVKKYYSDQALNKVILTYWTMVCFGKSNVPFRKIILIYLFSKIFNIFSLLNLFSIQNFKNAIYNFKNNAHKKNSLRNIAE